MKATIAHGTKFTAVAGGKSVVPPNINGTLKKKGHATSGTLTHRKRLIVLLYSLHISPETIRVLTRKHPCDEWDHSSEEEEEQKGTSQKRD